MRKKGATVSWGRCPWGLGSAATLWSRPGSHTGLASPPWPSREGPRTQGFVWRTLSSPSPTLVPGSHPGQRPERSAALEPYSQGTVAGEGHPGPVSVLGWSAQGSASSRGLQTSTVSCSPHASLPEGSELWSGRLGPQFHLMQIAGARGAGTVWVGILTHLLATRP